MSHQPPYGGGPPPYYGQHPPPPGPHGPYAYMPAPVMMPMPMPVYQPPPPAPVVDPAFSQPTYITNVYYPHQPPPDPVQVAETATPQLPPQSEDTAAHIDWVPATPASAPTLAGRAVVGGKEGWDGSPLWVIRAHHSGEFIPGKLAVKHRSAYVPHAGKEVPVHNFEVLCVPAHLVRWLPASNGAVPAGAIPAGNTHNAEPLYIGRNKHLRSITPGKVHPSHGCSYISFGGKEIAYKEYEVLCKIVG